MNTYRMSQNWRTNYLLPCILLLLLLTVIQCKQRYTRTSLPCNVTVVDLKYFFRFPKLLNSHYAGLDIGSES
jgi:hypothetical protein